MNGLALLRRSAAILAGALIMNAALAADAPVGVKIPAHQRFVLPNGLTIILVPKKEVPLIAFSGFVRGGALADPAGKPGVASLVAGLLDRGAGKRSAFEFADAVEGVGGSFNAGAGAESISVSGQFLARDRALMIELLGDALMRPRFDAEEFAKYRDREIEFIKSAKDSDPSQLLPEYGRALLFGAHPYGRPQGGSERSLASITQADVAGYHAANFGADKATLVFAGDLDPKWMKQALTKAFGGWARSKSTLPRLESAPRATGRRVLLVDAPDSVQTYFWLGNVGVDRRYSGRPALDQHPVQRHRCGPARVVGKGVVGRQNHVGHPSLGMTQRPGRLPFDDLGDRIGRRASILYARILQPPAVDTRWSVRNSRCGSGSTLCHAEGPTAGSSFGTVR